MPERSHRKVGHEDDEMSENPEGHWQLDKRVPVLSLTVLVLQLMGIFWLAATLVAQVGSLADNDAKQDSAINELAKQTTAQAVAGAVVSQELTDIRATLQRLERQGETMNNLLRNIGTEGRQ
jgi:Tfp pilus assembly protein PilO